MVEAFASMLTTSIKLLAMLIVLWGIAMTLVFYSRLRIEDQVGFFCAFGMARCLMGFYLLFALDLMIASMLIDLMIMASMVNIALVIALVSVRLAYNYYVNAEMTIFKGRGYSAKKDKAHS